MTLRLRRCLAMVVLAKKLERQYSTTRVEIKLELN